MGYKIDYYCLSHIGKIRKSNQDNFFCNGQHMEAKNDGTIETIQGSVNSSAHSVFCIFDGMGGEEHGEVAAYLAAKKMSEYAFLKDSEESFVAYCREANNEICRYTKENHLTSMGTTMAALVFKKNAVILCNIGDSKIFLLSGNDFQQISYDHVAFSVSGRKAPLIQNLGIPEDELILSPYIASGDYHNKDIYLICSDGLSDMVETDRIKEILCDYSRDTVCDALLQEALMNGGKDNITLILLYVNRKKFLNI